MYVMENWTVHKVMMNLTNKYANKNTVCLNMYHCRNSRHICLHLRNTCDAYEDCPFGDDELFCEL